MGHPTHVTIGQLKLDEKSNVRKTGRGAEAAFVANIAAKGILVPLTVRPNGSGYVVTNGGKRLAALKKLAEDMGSIGGVPANTYMVPIFVREENDADALDTSLAANIIMAPMHPVDRYEAFAQRMKDGASIEQLMADYAMTKLQVEQVIALGQLSDKVRQAWKDDKIGAQVAQAFTLEPNKTDQEKLFDKLEKQGNLQVFAIKQALKITNNEAGKLLQFVGHEIYEKAGGKVTRDLFGTSHKISDIKLAQRLAEERMAAECKKLLEAGWSWAEPISNLPAGASYQWDDINKRVEHTVDERKAIDKLQDELNNSTDYDRDEVINEEIDAIKFAATLRAFNEKDRKRSGCILEIRNNGELLIKYGVLKPEVSKAIADKKKQKEKAAKKKGPSEPAGLSGALVHRMSQSMTSAVTDTLRKDPTLALPVLIAALGSFESCIKVTTNGFADDDVSMDGDFGKELAKAQKKTPKQLLEALAVHVAGMVDMQAHYDKDLPFGPKADADDDGAALMNALDQEELYGNLGERFEREDYFNSVSKDTLLAAITEGVNKDEARKIAGKKRGEIAKFAIDNVHDDWFPPELRTKHYAGPGAKKRKAA